MKISQQILQINRNFVICFVVSALSSAVISQILSEQDSFLNASITIAFGYMIYFIIFSTLFYWDNKSRYKTMQKSQIRREVFGLISSFGVGEIIYLVLRWPTLYYFLEIEIEPFIASITSEIIATACYMIAVTLFLQKTKTF